MKKRVICFFSLILYLLLACLLLSVKIESEMMPQVIINERKNRGNGFGFNQSVLISDEDGRHLYEVVNGSGWDSGNIAQKLPASSWYIDDNGTVQFTGDGLMYRFVYSASRPLQEGENVTIIEETEKQPDDYLYLYDGGVPEEYVLPKTAEILAQTENALLLHIEEGQSPFLEQTALSLTDSTKTATRAFSLTDATRFVKTFPVLVALGFLIIAGIVFWGMACLFGLFFENHKIWVWRNITFAGVSIIILAILLIFVELPASMMPAHSIFDWQHYRDELVLITNSLKDMSIISPDFLAVQEKMYSCATNAIWIAAVTLMVIPIAEIGIFAFVQNRHSDNSDTMDILAR